MGTEGSSPAVKWHDMILTTHLHLATEVYEKVQI